MPRRRRRRRRSRSGSALAQKVAGIVLGGLAFAVVAAMVLVRPEAVPRDPDTMCPEAGPERVTAVLVDTTDRVSPPSRADILGRLEDMVLDSLPDEMVLVYEASAPVAGAVGSPAVRLPAPRIAVCNPGDPDTANPLISNPELIRRRLDERFRRPLAQLFQELVDGVQAPVSPIMEAIQAISVTVLARRPYAQIPKRLVVVSDLLQHSEHLSLYEPPPAYEAFAATPGGAALGTNLQDVAVQVLFVEREVHARLGGTVALVQFWERWIRGQGGQMERVSRLDGLN